MANSKPICDDLCFSDVISRITGFIDILKLKLCNAQAPPKTEPTTEEPPKDCQDSEEVECPEDGCESGEDSGLKDKSSQEENSGEKSDDNGSDGIDDLVEPIF